MGTIEQCKRCHAILAVKDIWDKKRFNTGMLVLYDKNQSLKQGGDILLVKHDWRAQRRHETRIIFCFGFTALLIFATSIALLVTTTRLHQVISASSPYIFNEIPAHIESSINVVEPRYGFTEEDIYLLAQLLCGDKDVDGDGEYDFDFKKEIDHYEVSKVLNVVMNRVYSDEFPNTVRDVVMQPGQFAVMPANAYKTPSDISLQVVREWCYAYDRYDTVVQMIPDDHLYFTGDGITNTTRANYR